jgi:hypothetical protein
MVPRLLVSLRGLLLTGTPVRTLGVGCLGRLEVQEGGREGVDKG